MKIMSEMIMCDKCKKNMYADDRSDKEDYCEIVVKYIDGNSRYHLCKSCHRQLMTEFIGDITLEQYDDIYGWREEHETN